MGRTSPQEIIADSFCLINGSFGIIKNKTCMESAELQEQIQIIFNNFDKDKSGTIELSELKQIAKELGEDIQEDQLAIIMDNLDANGDGKISLEEFKFWWLEGRKGKLGELVYLKAKSLKMTNTFLEQFTKAGVSLKEFNNSNKLLDIYDVCIGFGEPDPDGMKLEVDLYLRGDKFKMRLNKLKEKVKWLQDSSINFVIILPSEDPKKAKQDIEELLRAVMNTNILPFLSDSEDNPYIGFKLEPLEKELVFHIQIKKALSEVVSPPLSKFDEVKSLFDQNFYIWWNFGISTNFTMEDLLQKGNLVESLLKGFQIRLSGEAPNSVLKKFREVVEAAGGQGMALRFLFSILLKNAYLRLKLRSPLMVEKFFQKIGIKDILSECPTLSELLEQLSLMPNLQDIKHNVQSAGHLIYTALKVFKTNFDSGIDLFIHRDDSLVHVQTAFKNASTIFNIIFNEV